MSILIKGMTAEELLDVFQWARTGANNCMIGHGVVAMELPDHGDLIDRDKVWVRTMDYCDLEEAILKAPVVIPAERRRRMRLIDADAIPVVSADPYEEAGFRSVIEDMPTIDAVTVVRCKDCEFYTEEERWCRRLGLCGAFDPNGYCSHAERSEDGET